MQLRKKGLNYHETSLVVDLRSKNASLIIKLKTKRCFGKIYTCTKSLANVPTVEFPLFVLSKRSTFENTTCNKTDTNCVQYNLCFVVTPMCLHLPWGLFTLNVSVITATMTTLQVEICVFCSGQFCH